jgi:hypothetical protein
MDFTIDFANVLELISWRGSIGATVGGVGLLVVEMFL